MNRRPTHLMLVLLAVLALFALASCPGADPYADLYGIWHVDTIEYQWTTGDWSEPWIKLSKDAFVTFVYYNSTEWRHCTQRSGNVTSIDGDSITFTEDYSGSSVTVGYTFDGTTFSISWPDDSGPDPGEIYHMTVTDALFQPEGDAISSPCFN